MKKGLNINQSAKLSIIYPSINWSLSLIFDQSINQPIPTQVICAEKKTKVGQKEKTWALAGYVNFIEVIFRLGAVVS